MCADTPATYGGVFRYDKCKGVKELFSNFKVTGGFDWNSKGDKFYFVDACRKAIVEFDYDGKTGKLYKYSKLLLTLNYLFWIMEYFICFKQRMDTSCIYIQVDMVRILHKLFHSE